MLAMMLTPNIWLHSQFGKVVFVAIDVIVGIQILLIVGTSITVHRSTAPKMPYDDNSPSGKDALKNPHGSTSNGTGSRITSLCVLAWMFNPLTMGLSTRGIVL